MEFYRHVRVSPWTRALSYAAAFFALMAVLYVAAAAPRLVWLHGQLLSRIEARVPADAEFRFEDGALVTNQDKPLDLGDDAFLFVIDDDYAGGKDDAPKALTRGRAGVYAGRDAVFFSDGEDVTAATWDDADVFRDGKTMTRDEALAWLRGTGALLMYAGLGIAALLIFAVFFAVNAIGAALLAAAATALTPLFGVRLAYSQWFAVTLHAATLPVAVAFLLSQFGIVIPFAGLFIKLMFITAVAADERANPSHKKLHV